ncbi:MAG TPA: hypothetical protein VGF24_27470 [Vicinamibacterales bacterium]|jgi:hypothetical protein
MAPHNLIGRALSCLLEDEYCIALMGDLAEERARRARADGPHQAARWYRTEICRSVAAAVRQRLAETARSAPWTLAIGAYMLVAVLEVTMRSLLSRVWPDAAQSASALRLVVELPGIALIAYVAGRFDRRAPLLLGAMMLVAAISITTLSTEAMSTAFIVACLTIGPGGAVLGARLARERRLT